MRTKMKILVENDVFFEDEIHPKNTLNIASNYFDVIGVDSVLDVDKHINQPICFYRGSFAVGALLYQAHRNAFCGSASFFNCLNWVAPLKQFYINKKYNIIDMESCLGLTFPTFIRPCGGNKAFSGQLFTSKNHYETEYKFTTVNRNVSKDTLCLYAKPKKILEEYRCVFVDHNLVATCGYLENGERKDFQTPQKAIDLAIEISKSAYFNIPNFVIDVCLSEDEQYFLLEINSINNASFYSCDLHSIYKALAIHFEEVDLLKYGE